MKCDNVTDVGCVSRALILCGPTDDAHCAHTDVLWFVANAAIVEWPRRKAARNHCSWLRDCTVAAAVQRTFEDHYAMCHPSRRPITEVGNVVHEGTCTNRTYRSSHNSHMYHGLGPWRRCDSCVDVIKGLIVHRKLNLNEATLFKKVSATSLDRDTVRYCSDPAIGQQEATFPTP